MKRFTLPSLLFVATSIFSSVLFAHTSFKGETIPVVATFYNWSGFYAGVNVGGVKHTMNITDTDATTFNATIQQTTNPKFTGGLQLGYRRQLDLTKASGVYGLEISANFSDATFSKEYGSPFALYQLYAKNELKSLVLLQLIGGIAADRTYLFLSAGMSWVDINGRVTNVDGIPFFNSFSVSKNAFGTAFGAGAEYAFTDALSARIKLDVITPKVYNTTDDVGDNFQISNNIVQATFGINYKFA